MAIHDVSLSDESKTRYLTYALSVVHSRALPDIRDGLKPVQRRILYAMARNLHLTPEKDFRKSAAVVGEVLARFHPHGDSACYEAMVRMAQDFSLRYPLVDGQGNFGSLDGDSAAAYRYTEARLTALAMEVIGEIEEETVSMRLNFDQTTSEPVVLPSRVPNLLINGASGIAVGMATAIPPHNLREVVQALLLLLEDPEVQDAKLFKAVKGPDFPTGCQIINTNKELKEIYSTGKGPIRMRAAYRTEEAARGKEYLVITSVPFGVDKSQIVERIADLIIGRKIPQLNDVRDESTDEVRVVLEMVQGANAEQAMAYLFKHTALETNFNVNMTAIVPTDDPLVGRPATLSLRDSLQYFIDFRIEVTTRKLTYERDKLAARIHLLEGLMSIADKLKEVIEIVRKSEGRLDAAAKLQKRFSLSEAQSLFIVDLRIYQLSRTSVEEIEAELTEKQKRVKEIEKILASKKLIAKEIAADLQRVAEQYGDERRSKIVSDFEEKEFDEDAYIADEDCFVVVTKDGWLKRLRTSNDPLSTRIREGDSFLSVFQASTKDTVALFTSHGNSFVMKVFELSSTGGFGEPVQKLFRFDDGETIVAALRGVAGDSEEQEFLFVTAEGLGFRAAADIITETKKSGRRVAKIADDDSLAVVKPMSQNHVFILSKDGYGVLLQKDEVPVLTGAGKGVILQKMSRGDSVVAAASVTPKQRLLIRVAKGPEKEVELAKIIVGTRARRGDKVVVRNTPVLSIVEGNGKELIQ